MPPGSSGVLLTIPPMARSDRRASIHETVISVLWLFLPLGSTAAVLLLWPALKWPAATREFFAAAVAVIPLFLLTLAVDASYFKRRITFLERLPGPNANRASRLYAGVWRFYGWTLRAQLLAIIGYGEAGAFHALGSHHLPTRGETASTTTALVTAFAAVVVVALTREPGE